MASNSTTANRFVRLFLWCSLGTIVIAYGVLYFITTPLLERQYAADVAVEIEEVQAAYASGGTSAVKDLIDRRVEESRRYEAVYLLQSATGLIVAGNLGTWPNHIDPDGRWHQVKLLRWPEINPVTIGFRAIALPNRQWVLVGRDLKTSSLFQRRITEALTVALIITTIIGIVGSYLLSRMLLQRVDMITNSVDDIMRDNLSRRFRISNESDEFDRLARALNGMLDRITELMTAMRTITDSVAHDFRSSLMRMKTRLAALGQEERTDPHARETISAIVGETDALLASLSALLEIARAEAGLAREQMTNFDLSALVNDLGELYQPVAEEQGYSLRIEAKEELRVRGHRQLLAQAVSNLLENALKYSPPGGEVLLKTSLGQAGPVVSVSDQGPGIEQEDRERAKERFVQIQNSHTMDGEGLGLSLVAAVARLHQADFALSDNDPGLRASIKFLTLGRR